MSDVRPPERLDEIRSRTTGRPAAPSSTRWLPLTIAAAAAVVLVIGGTAWVANLTSEDSPAAGPERPGATTGADDSPGRDLNVPVTYVGATAAGPRLFTESHEVGDTTDSPLQAAVSEAFGARPEDPDYRNYLRDLGVTAGISKHRDSFHLHLDGPLDRPEGMNEETAQMVLQSLVWTVDQADASDLPIRFLVNGEAASEVLGIDTTQPIAKDSPDSVLSTVSIASPGEDAHLSTTFTVHGQAATFEANVVWELKQGDRVVKHGFTTAAECCTLSPYSFTVTAPKGAYTLVVHDVDESDGEGVGTSQDTKSISLY